ncbi:MAG: tetratricopeptide repeat protein [Paludibaculum sp.]
MKRADRALPEGGRPGSSTRTDAAHEGDHLNDLRSLRRQKRYDEAAPYSSGPAIAGRVQGSTRAASILGNHAGFQAETGRCPLAVATFGHAIELSVETRGEDDPDVALLRLEFAALRRAQGHYVGVS